MITTELQRTAHLALEPTKAKDAIQRALDFLDMPMLGIDRQVDIYQVHTETALNPNWVGLTHLNLLASRLDADGYTLLGVEVKDGKLMLDITVTDKGD